MTDYSKTLPMTGAGLAIGGTFIQQSALLGIALGMVLTGTLLVRLGFRRGKTPLDS